MSAPRNRSFSASSTDGASARPRPTMHRILPAPRISTASSPMVRTPRSRPMAATSVSPTGQMGNSEVGHTNIGAGRIVAMDLGQIDLAIEDGSFLRERRNPRFIDTLKDSGGTAHLFGVVSDGGVHGHIDHMRWPPRMIDGRGRSGGHARHHRRARRAAEIRRAVHRPAGEPASGGRAHRHGDRPLLRHGPRQPLGPGRAGLRRDGASARARAPTPPPRRSTRLRRWQDGRIPAAHA
jgi:hypothetical protein